MKVIIEIPDAMFNGVAGLFTMLSPKDSDEVLSAMEQCHKTEELVLQLDDNEETHVKVKSSVAVMAFTQVITNITSNDTAKHQTEKE